MCVVLIMRSGSANSRMNCRRGIIGSDIDLCQFQHKLPLGEHIINPLLVYRIPAENWSNIIPWRNGWWRGSKSSLFRLYPSFLPHASIQTVCGSSAFHSMLFVYYDKGYSEAWVQKNMTNLITEHQYQNIWGIPISRESLLLRFLVHHFPFPGESDQF